MPSVNKEKILPIERSSIFRGIIRRFEELVRAGTFKPGQKLPPETKLAKEFGVSRGTLREALKALNLVGLVVSRSGSGTYVGSEDAGNMKRAASFATALKGGDFMALFEVRIAIEPVLAQLAALRATPQDLDRIKECLRQVEASLGDTEKYTRFEIAFHELVSAAARSPLLNGVMEAYRDLLLRGRTEVTPYGPDRRSLEFHIKIFEAIAKKDPALARKAMEEDIRNSQRNYLRLWQDVQKIAPPRYEDLSKTRAIKHPNDSQRSARKKSDPSSFLL